MFSPLDLTQILQHGISKDSAERQQDIVNQNKINVNIIKPALKQDGLFLFGKQDINNIISGYSKKIAGQEIVKFVPASGAATRMFKDLFIALEELSGDEMFDNYTDAVSTFFENLPRFAFFDLLKERLMKKGLDIDKLLAEKKYQPVLLCLLTEQGLNYAKLPKGLLLFHRYVQHTRTALEEHLTEAAGYACGDDKVARLHFTVSPEHMDHFQLHCRQVVPLYEKQFGITYKIDFSTQHSSTDTIAFTKDNEPFRNRKGSLVFRPGGHGSLIENLNNIKADIVLIKNIDNVTLDKYKPDTIEYKKLLVSFLLSLREQVFACLNRFDKQSLSSEEIKKAEDFLRDKFFIRLEEGYDNLPLADKQVYLYRILDRPIRVCGMVQREEEPGGGPFWVKDSNGKLSLQIVETSEMDLSDLSQQANLETSEFFNPVDLACSVKNHRGEPFNLLDFVDYSRYFISEKSHEGKTLKAIENPGLWNGAMSDWLTVFIAVPLSTFTPVKTVNDLLRKEHVNS